MAILEVEHLEKRFGGTPVLQDVSFSLEQGQTLAILGSSGSGKTTLLRCLNALEQPDAGRIRVAGETLFDGGVRAAQRGGRLPFGLVFQAFHLFPQYTVRENVTLVGRLQAKRRPDYRANRREILQRIDDEAAREVALRSRGTPRIANALLRRVRDFAMVKGGGRIDLEITRYALNALNIDSRGLDRMDNKILRTIIDKFGGGPVGLGTIATAVSEDTGTIEEVYEPFLIKEGFLKRTPRGREATELAYTHLGLVPPASERTLF